MFNRVFIPLFETIANDAEVIKIFGERFTFNAPVKAKFPYAFVHIIGDTIDTMTDDNMILHSKNRLAIRIVANEKATKNELELYMSHFTRIIKDFVRENSHIFFKLEMSENSGIFFESDNETNYTQFERSFVLYFF